LTLQNCFPVNEDGIGNCPEPECCKELRDKIGNGVTSNSCNITNLPSIQFRGNSIRISQDAEAMLANVAEQLKANPECRVRISGHGPVSKAAQQLSWDRVNAVIKYLVEKQGIAESRFIFEYGTEGDPNSVDLIGTTDQGPNTVPAPHPNLRRNK
jgi:outer membrane protein OmpA-like peptidoglycan-associated protein